MQNSFYYLDPDSSRGPPGILLETLHTASAPSPAPLIGSEAFFQCASFKQPAHARPCRQRHSTHHWQLFQTASQELELTGLLSSDATCAIHSVPSYCQNPVIYVSLRLVLCLSFCPLFEKRKSEQRTLAPYSVQGNPLTSNPSPSTYTQSFQSPHSCGPSASKHFFFY